MSKKEPIDWPPPPVGVVVVAKLRSAKSINVLSKEGVSCIAISPLAVFSAAGDGPCVVTMVTQHYCHTHSLFHYPLSPW